MNLGIGAVIGGSTLLLMLVFQILTGRRVIRFKGPLHMKVHTWVAYAMLAFTFVHLLVGLQVAGLVRF